MPFDDGVLPAYSQPTAAARLGAERPGLVSGKQKLWNDRKFCDWTFDLMESISNRLNEGEAKEGDRLVAVEVTKRQRLDDKLQIHEKSALIRDASGLGKSYIGPLVIQRDIKTFAWPRAI
jgi:hypothetical protein